MTTNEDLLEVLLLMQKEYPERMGDKLFGWDESQCYPTIGFHLLEEPYVNPHEEGFGPLSEYPVGEDLTQEELDSTTHIPKGSLILTLD